MSIKTLIIFVTVYKEESITAAARKLNLSQPAVSAAIKELENHYSVRLFERMGRGIQKTNAAHHLYEFASHITALYLEMDKDFKKQERATPLRIGSSISIGTCLMPGYIKEYMDTFHVPMPYIKIDSSDIIEKMVLENNLDLALIEGCIHSDKLMAEPFTKDKLVLICSPFHPLASKKTVALDDIKEEHFLLRERNSGTRELAESTLMLQDFLLKPILESTSTTAIINAVIAGLGISILPERMLTDYFKSGKLVPLQIKGIEFKREYHIIYHQNKYLNPEIIHLIEFIKR
ncbi:LysR family transcriptional regulator [Clostridium sp. Marseille-P2415]|uniref:LysR family transcriptional regulator n=1 Tax=Clostridium sp. Marseille-P2415 TaxID=1805471 RepID=UPI000988303E|nr:LysR family transcriptional regulator [Clostridium sp. Marseille-P2415]